MLCICHSRICKIRVDMWLGKGHCAEEEPLNGDPERTVLSDE